MEPRFCMECFGSQSPIYIYIFTKWLKTNYRIDSFLLENILISNAAGRGYAPSAGLPDAKVQEDFKSRRNTCMPAALFNRFDMAHALDVQQVQIIVTKKTIRIESW